MNITEFRKGNYIEEDNSLVFETTPLSKVFLLSLFTGGIYDIILIFNYWKALRDKFDLKISCFWRAIFLIFTNIRLFPLLSRYFKKYGLTMSKSLAFWYFFMTYLSFKAEMRTINTTNWLMEVFSLIFSIIGTIIIVLIQHKINKVNNANIPNAPKNPWKVSNIIWLIICAGITVLAYLPE